ncbi:hypothetical protein ACJVDH_07570 [Pedobacter sp. AW1-32]|uniref:hypothetical protein n=1 Tax=Pedobacter sp. AW1-32 TaxID=3383026 RepID=UPI003FF0B918
MENEQHPKKIILKPSHIHEDLPEIEHPHHESLDRGDLLPENPERNYHHQDDFGATSKHDRLDHADDDVWNGEDA